MSMSYRPSAGNENARAQAPVNEPLSLVDRYSSIEGTFTTTRDVRVEGVVRGKLECQGLLYVAEGADIDATVEAANITVAGKLNGEVICPGRLQIMPSGQVVATVTTDSLVIDEGAFYEGDLTMKSSGMGMRASTSPATSGESPSVLRRFSSEESDEGERPRSDRGTATP